MGLFDNLFLDANTPITINDGIDHSKDVVQAVVDPTFEVPKSGNIGNSSEGTSNITTGEKKDDSLVDLFESDKKEEEDAALALNPEPPKDIALEIGYSNPVVSSDPSVSFDIGGDLNFDIGGNITGGTDPGTPTFASSDAMSVLGKIEVTNTEVLHPEAIGATIVPEIGSVTLLQAGSAPEISVLENNSNNTLFALLNDAPTSGDMAVGPVAVSEVPIQDSVSPPGSISSAFPSLLEDTPSEVALEPQAENALHQDNQNGSGSSHALENGSSTELMGNNNVGITGCVTGGGDMLSLTTQNHAHEHFQNYDTLSHLDSGMGRITSSSKLKSKLAEFLSELESMESGDESQKAHKLQQIEMCRMRIAEIRREYDSRIHALQGEMQLLEKEIRDMDGEKTHIKTVIEAFQKELDIA